MKKVVVVLLVLFLVACNLRYERKDDDNEHYYHDYVNSVGLKEYEEINNQFGVDNMNDAYKIAGIDETSSSFFIYHYMGEDDNEKKFHVLMPERVGEENLVFEDHLPSFADLETYVSNYNDSTDSDEVYRKGKKINTNDIILEEEYLRTDVVWRLYSDRVIDDVRVEADTEEIRDMIFNNLSSPFIYRVGVYYKDDEQRGKDIYLGKGIDNDLVFIYFDLYKIEVEIIYTYDYE